MPTKDAHDGHAESLRITEKILSLPSPRQRTGMREVDLLLSQRGVPADVRLHFVSALTHLSQEASNSLERRVREAGRPRDS